MEGMKEGLVNGGLKVGDVVKCGKNGGLELGRGERSSEGRPRKQGERHGSCEERRRAGEESKKREGMFQVRVKEVRKGEKDQ